MPYSLNLDFAGIDVFLQKRSKVENCEECRRHSDQDSTLISYSLHLYLSSRWMYFGKKGQRIKLVKSVVSEQYSFHIQWKRYDRL